MFCWFVYQRIQRRSLIGLIFRFMISTFACYSMIFTCQINRMILSVIHRPVYKDWCLYGIFHVGWFQEINCYLLDTNGYVVLSKNPSEVSDASFDGIKDCRVNECECWWLDVTSNQSRHVIEWCTVVLAFEGEGMSREAFRTDEGWAS